MRNYWLHFIEIYITFKFGMFWAFPFDISSHIPKHWNGKNVFKGVNAPVFGLLREGMGELDIGFHLNHLTGNFGRSFVAEEIGFIGIEINAERVYHYCVSDKIRRIFVSIEVGFFPISINSIALNSIHFHTKTVLLFLRLKAQVGGIYVDLNIIKQLIHDIFNQTWQTSLFLLLLHLLASLLQKIGEKLLNGQFLHIHKYIVQVQKFFGHQDRMDIADIQSYRFLAPYAKNDLYFLNIAKGNVAGDIVFDE